VRKARIFSLVEKTKTEFETKFGFGAGMGFGWKVEGERTRE
jgi:hypothetical protein